MARGVPFCLLVLSLICLPASVMPQEEFEEHCSNLLLKAAQARAQNSLIKAEEYSKQALQFAHWSKNDSLIQQCLVDLSNLHIYFKKYSKALREQNAALKLQEELFGVRHISSLNSAAALIKIELMLDNEPKNAMARLQEIQTEQEKKLGEDHVEVARNLITQAQIVVAELKEIPEEESLEESTKAASEACSKATIAITQCERALAILEKRYGKRHDELDEALTTIDELISFSPLRGFTDYRLQQQNIKARKINSVDSQLLSFRPEKPIHYGLIVGLNWASAYGKGTEGNRSYGTTVISNHVDQLHRMCIGMTGSIWIYPKIAFQPEITLDFKGFSREGMKLVKDYNWSYYSYYERSRDYQRLTYLSIPIKAKYYPKPFARPQPFVLAGPVLNINLASETNNKLSESYEDAKSLVLGWRMGIGFHMPDGVNEFEFYYNWDLVSVYKGEKIRLKTFTIKLVYFM